MVRIGTYVVIGLLCLAMAAGVFLGGPPPSASPQKGPAGKGGPDGPAMSALSAGDLRMLEQQRTVIRSLVVKNGGDAASLETVDGRLEAIQTVLDARGKDANNYELRSLGVVLGDAMAEGLKMKWVSVRDGGRNIVALTATDVDLLASPIEFFVQAAQAEEPIEVQALYDLLREEIGKARSQAPPAPAAP